MHFGMPDGLSRFATRVLRMGRDERAASPEASPSMGFSWQSGERPRAESGSPSPEGWRLSPTTPTLRVTNPDLPLPGDATRPVPNYGKPLPALPPEAFEPYTPLSISRSGSPEGNLSVRSLMYSTHPSPIDAAEAPRALRVMNPDPEPKAPFTNWSRPFGPGNPFPERPVLPMQARPAPYRPGLDPYSPLYRGEITSVPLRPYRHIRPSQTARPRPPLTPLIIPNTVPRYPVPILSSDLSNNFPNRNGIPSGRARFSVESPLVASPDSAAYARPANPTPYHPYNLHPQPREPMHFRGTRSRGNSVATPPGLDTIMEVNESAVKRKPAPPIPPPKDYPPQANSMRFPSPVAAPRRSGLPKGLRWLDFRKWGSKTSGV